MRNNLNQFVALTGITHAQIVKLTCASVLAGALNLALMYLLGQSLKQASVPELMQVLWKFLLTLAVYFVIQRMIQVRVARLTETGIAELRRKIAQAIYMANQLQSEQIDLHIKTSIFGRDAGYFGSALSHWVSIIASAATATCGIGYLFSLSFEGALIVSTIIGGTVVTYRRLARIIHARLTAAYRTLDQFFGYIDDLLRGTKELKLERTWAAEFIRNDLMATLNRSARLLGGAKARQQDLTLSAVVAFFLVVGTIAFGFRVYVGMHNPVAAHFILVLLFLQIHIHAVIQRLPTLGEAAISGARIRDLLQRLRHRSEAELFKKKARPMPGDWQAIKLSGVGFEYSAAQRERFALRDINLAIHRGQTVFIVGGNGSGKTTLAKIIMGLYRPTAGGVAIAGIPVTDKNLLDYRGLYSAVFSDAHLFSRNVDGQLAGHQRAVRALLAELKIDLPVTADGRVDVRPLSQGQKKRLASTLAMLEDKPILFFDEWTADQDPEFRVYFYDCLLPKLKQAGKTVIAITHDDRYFSRADQLIRLDAGTIKPDGRDDAARAAAAARA